MKIYIVIEGEFNEGSKVRGVYSTREKALIQVEKCKETYFIKDANWRFEYLSDIWINAIDYIQIETWELDNEHSSYNDNLR